MKPIAFGQLLLLLSKITHESNWSHLCDLFKFIANFDRQTALAIQSDAGYIMLVWLRLAATARKPIDQVIECLVHEWYLIPIV